MISDNRSGFPVGEGKDSVCVCVCGVKSLLYVALNQVA